MKEVPGDVVCIDDGDMNLDEDAVFVSHEGCRELEEAARTREDAFHSEAGQIEIEFG